MSSRSTRTCWTISAFLFPLLFFVAAVNPYLLPEQYDNVLYYFGAQSLAETGSFKWEGYYIQNWPPVLSAMMAIPFALGLNSVAIGKLVVVLSVALTLTWGYRLFQLEGREHALLTFFFAGLLPAGFLMGTRIMSEWPYAALSMLFFILLYQMRYDRGMPLALLAGAVLGAASLTRWVGVLLGIALIAQAMPYVWNRRPKWRAVLPEFAAAVFGATIWAIWKAKLAYQVHMGTASANWYFDGSNFLAYFSVSAFWKTLGDLFFQSNSILSVAGLQNHPAALLLILPAAVTLLGLFWHFRYYRQPADWYVLATLVLFLCFRWKHTRYLVPLAPFLLFYFFMGISCLAHWTKVNIWRTWPCKLTLAGWAAALVLSLIHI